MQTPFVKRYAPWLMLLLFAIVVIAFYWQYAEVNVDEARRFALTVVERVAEEPLRYFVVVGLFYIAVCSVPFPFISLITVAIGYAFGMGYGLVIASFGSAIGGLLLFLFTRRFAREATVRRVLARFPSLKPATESQDFWVAVSIRFIPALPFFIPSLLFGMTRLPALKFYLSTQIGLFVTMAVYVNAGDSLADLSSSGQVFSPRLVLAMLLLAILPLMMKVIQHYRLKNARVGSSTG